MQDTSLVILRRTITLLSRKNTLLFRITRSMAHTTTIVVIIMTLNGMAINVMNSPGMANSLLHITTMTTTTTVDCYTGTWSMPALYTLMVI